MRVVFVCVCFVDVCLCAHKERRYLGRALGAPFVCIIFSLATLRRETRRPFGGRLGRNEEAALATVAPQRDPARPVLVAGLCLRIRQLVCCNL